MNKAVGSRNRTDGGTRSPPLHLVAAYDRDVQPVEFTRILALSDGVFAIALTLLVLDLSLPVVATGITLVSALSSLQSNFFAFAISVVVVGIIHGLHHRLFGLLQRLDARLIALNVIYLGLVALIPFFQRVVSEYAHDPLAFAAYGTILGAISLLDGTMLWHAHRSGQLRHPIPRADARLELFRGVLPIAAFFGSVPLAFLIGGWTVLLWVAIAPLDALLSRLETNSSTERALRPEPPNARSAHSDRTHGPSSIHTLTSTTPPNGGRIPPSGPEREREEPDREAPSP